MLSFGLKKAVQACKQNCSYTLNEQAHNQIKYFGHYGTNFLRLYELYIIYFTILVIIYMLDMEVCECSNMGFKGTQGSKL